jgi:hypothetical protein
MAKQISSLSVALNATVAPFVRSMAVAKKSVTGFAVSVRGASSSLLRMSGIAGALSGALAAIGFSSLIKSQFDTIDAAGKLSDRLGITTAALAALTHAADLSGVSNELLTGSLEKYLRNVAEAASGNVTAAKSFQELGLSAQALSSLPTDEAIGKIADALNAIENPAAKAAAAQDIFGKSGQALLPLLKEGSGGLAAFAKEADALGLSFSRVDATKVEAANDAVSRAKAAFVGVARTISVAISPAIQAAADRFTGWAKTVVAAAKSVSQPIQRIASAVGGYVSSVVAQWSTIGKAIVEAFDPAGATVEGFTNNVVSFLGFATKYVLTIAKVISSAITGAAGVIRAYVLPIVKSLASFVVTAAQNIYALVVPVVQQIAGFIVSAMQAVYSRVAPIVRAIASTLASNWSSIQAVTARVFRSVVQLVSGAMTIASDIISAAWGAITTVWTTATGFITGRTESTATATAKWTQWIVDAWTSATSLIADALTTVGFYMENWRTLVDATISGVVYRVLQFGNTAAWVFTDVVPAALKFLSENWSNILRDLVVYTGTVLSNLASNVVSVFTNLPGLISGSVSFGDIWKPLTDGFKATVGEFPQIAERAIGPLEQGFKDEADKLQNILGKGLNDALVQQRTPAKEGSFFGPILSAAKMASEQAKRVAGSGVAAVNKVLGSLATPEILTPDLASIDPFTVEIDTDQATENVKDLKSEVDSLKLVVAGSAEAFQARLQIGFDQQVAAATPKAPNVPAAAPDVTQVMQQQLGDIVDIEDATTTVTQDVIRSAASLPDVSSVTQQVSRSVASVEPVAPVTQTVARSVQPVPQPPTITQDVARAVQPVAQLEGVTQSVSRDIASVATTLPDAAQTVVRAVDTVVSPIPKIDAITRPKVPAMTVPEAPRQQEPSVAPLDQREQSAMRKAAKDNLALANILKELQGFRRDVGSRDIIELAEAT